MGRWHLHFAAVLSIVAAVSGRIDDGGNVLTPRQQKEAYNATTGPSRGGLPWGKMNFIHTTDTHGWLEGHMNERNYGGDWGDFVSFVKRMRDKADDLKVDLLVVDTGDLHDGNGLSDISDPKGAVSDSIFANVEYDLLTIGNHGVQLLKEAKNIQANISKIYADRYLTSNVYISGKGEEQIGVPYRHFTTKYGTRVMAFGILYDDGNNDQSIKIETAKQMMERSWFTEAMKKEVDLYVILGHGSLRNNSDPTKKSAFLDFEQELRKKLKTAGKEIPIQLLGGHTHIRDFRCFDELTSGLQSGKYGDTVGWLALDNFDIRHWQGATSLKDVPTPTKTCPARTKPANPETTPSNVPLLDRRYLDWNVRTFMYHAVGPNESNTAKFDTPLGRKVTRDIDFARHALNLTYHLGCAKETWCLWCTDKKNIMTLAKPAVLETVVNESLSNHRAVIITGTSFRYDLFQGPFTLGDALAVVPFTDAYHYVELNFTMYQAVLQNLNVTRPSASSKGDIYNDNTGLDEYPPVVLPERNSKQDVLSLHARDEPDLTPGYTTKDDLGDEGDDTKHSPFIDIGKNLPTVAVEANIPRSPPSNFTLDLVVTTHTEGKVLRFLNLTDDHLPLYMERFTTGDVLPEYARRNWNSNTKDDSCPVGP
ncbi:hypothetical protein BBP40_002281 [Aspergillus hancockii]|nr:hypothetical protein BBP40_002281 [Aspergillus hancockii]